MNNSTSELAQIKNDIKVFYNIAQGLELNHSFNFISDAIAAFEASQDRYQAITGYYFDEYELDYRALNND